MIGCVAEFCNNLSGILVLKYFLTLMYTPNFYLVVTHPGYPGAHH